MKRISVVLGTRPEAVKLCPVILAMRAHAALAPHVCATGQHRQLLDQVLEVFVTRPEVDLNLMRPGQSPGELAARAVAALDTYYAQHRPDLVVVQGDTTTAFAAALAAFYRGIKVAHVEAGLRTGNDHAPFPEEMHRVLTTRLAEYHFAPTPRARQRLLDEGVADERITVTGNTAVDALQLARERIRRERTTIDGLPESLTDGGDASQPLVLITGHRRESIGRGFESICGAVRTLADRFPQTAFVYPLHLNPSVRRPAVEILDDVANVHLIEPLGYLPFVALMERSTLILTDSGGIQEEAPSLGKPVLVMREATDRPEAVEAGTARLVGTEKNRIVEGVTELLTDPAARERMAGKNNPYGDGKASERIVEVLAQDVSEGCRVS